MNPECHDVPAHGAPPVFPLGEEERVMKNDHVIAFAEKGRDAHPDTVERLLQSCSGLGEYAVIRLAPVAYSAVAIATNDTCFAVAHGVSVCIRLPEILAQRAVRCGAEPEPELGPEWVAFELFRSDWPDPDLPFWLLKAYAEARR
jgi:hypothetical protein